LALHSACWEEAAQIALSAAAERAVADALDPLVPTAMLRLRFLLLALLGLAGCANDQGVRQAGGDCRLIPVAQLPVESPGNMVFTEAEIDGKSVKLLVDTGAERTLLTETTVERLHLARDLQHATRTYGIGSPTATWDAKLPDGIVLGGMRLPVDRVTVGRFGISEVAGHQVDGLLGADVLLGFDIDLDLPAQEMTLYRARRECPDAAPPWNQAYVDVAGVSIRKDRLMLPFELNGVAGIAVLDTGAQMSSISREMAARVGLLDSDLADDRTVMAHGAAPDQVPVRIHRFSEFRIGPTETLAPMLPVVPMVSGMGDALVGGDFLRDRRVWLSFSTRRVFVTPVEGGPWIAATRTEE
jgi:predicted aspartyl protease